MSWKLQVRLAGDDYWRNNFLRFATKDEALLYGFRLAERWPPISDGRVVHSEDDVNSVRCPNTGTVSNTDDGQAYGHNILGGVA